MRLYPLSIIESGCEQRNHVWRGAPMFRTRAHAIETLMVMDCFDPGSTAWAKGIILDPSPSRKRFPVAGIITLYAVAYCMRKKN